MHKYMICTEMQDVTQHTPYRHLCHLVPKKYMPRVLAYLLATPRMSFTPSDVSYIDKHTLIRFQTYNTNKFSLFALRENSSSDQKTFSRDIVGILLRDSYIMIHHFAVVRQYRCVNYTHNMCGFHNGLLDDFKIADMDELIREEYVIGICRVNNIKKRKFSELKWETESTLDKSARYCKSRKKLTLLSSAERFFCPFVAFANTSLCGGE